MKTTSTTRKNYELQTITTDIDSFVYDIFMHEAKQLDIRQPKIDPLLKQSPGVSTNDVKIQSLINAVKGLANSFELNGMYGLGDLANYQNAQDFLNKFWQVYEGKAMKDISSAKRDKAETPEAKARAEEDKKKVKQGLDMVLGLF